MGFASTQLPCVHDLTWFTNSAEAADALYAFTHTHSPSATAQSASKANKRQHHTGTTTSTIGLTTDGSAQSEQSDDIR